jgi:acetylornithine deacetylase/succinyl-diaminopimelate desuccinylase-like protein
MRMTNLPSHLTTQQKRFLEELLAFLRIPSVSTLVENQDAIRQAAEFVRDKLVAAGADQARLIETYGRPLVYAEKILDKNLPTVLVYGHYDVQPADPYELWDSPPFEPTIKEDKIFARGASDDKGQVYMHIKALELLIASQQLPCNVKFLIEGEEECGSAGLTQFLGVAANRALIEADTLLVSDSSLLSMEQPSLTTGLRGIIYFEVEVIGPKRDLHSGVYGGAVANPINSLCKMIAALQGEQRQITIPGFYDQVASVSAAQRKGINEVDLDLAQYKEALGIQAVVGEEGYTTLERVGIRPSLDVNGIWGGYTAAGAKTVLPSKAYAKISMRLVPNQDAQEIAKLFTSYFTSLAPDGIRVNIKTFPGGSNAIVLGKESLALKAAQAAFETIWNKHPVSTRDGGSIPILTKLKEALNCDMVMMGFGLDSDAIHSPNEHFGLNNFFKGIDTITAFYKQFARLFGQQ